MHTKEAGQYIGKARSSLNAIDYRNAVFLKMVLRTRRELDKKGKAVRKNSNIPLPVKESLLNKAGFSYYLGLREANKSSIAGLIMKDHKKKQEG